MKKVLLTFVGLQDPYSNKTDSEGSILTLARSIEPDLVFMLPSKRLLGSESETETNAKDTKEWLMNFVNLNEEDIYTFPLSLANPTNIPVLLEQGSIEIKQILETLEEEDVEIAINTSSGTPQMQSCWYIWANSGLFAPYQIKLYQIGNPQYVPEEKRVETITIEFMEEGNTIERIQQYLKRAMYLAASEEGNRLSQISSYSNRRTRAEIIANISMAYHNWDLLNYTKALPLLRRLLVRYDRSIDLANLTELLKRQIEALNLLNNSESDTIAILTDVYFNAVRRFRQNAYADTLARIWRLIEGCLYYRLRSKHGVEPRNLSLSKNQDNVSKINVGSRDLKELSFARSIVALRDLEDSEYISFEKRQVELPWVGTGFRKQKISTAMEKVRTIRNGSIVAHGIKPVSCEVANASLEIGRLFLDFTFKDDGFVSAYPFKGEECVNNLMELLY